MSQNRSSCVLVVEQRQLLGILTERDIVKMTASNASLEGVVTSSMMSRDLITRKASATGDVFQVFSELRAARIRHLPIVGEDGQLVGLVTSQSLREALQPTDLLKLRRVFEVMILEVISATPSVSVFQIVELLATHRVSCVVICQSPTDSQPNSEEKVLTPIGIITERDIVQFRALGLDLSQTSAQEVMSTPLLPIKAGDSLWEARQMMHDYRIRRLVVTDEEGKLAGLITQSSLLQVLDPLEMQKTIEVLQQAVMNERHKAKSLEVERAKLSSEVMEHQQMEAEIRQQLIAQRELGELRSRLVETISHEYRTPLQIISMSAESLQRKSDQLTEERKNKHWKRIQASIQQMTQLVEKALTFDKIQGAELPFNPQPVAVEAFCQELMARQQEFASDRQVFNFSYRATLTTVFLDWQLLQLILGNLLDNAVKFSPEDSVVSLAVFSEQDAIVFEVKDKGIGIPPTDRGRVFETFFRGSNVGTISGTGIGLSIVNKCVKIHQGQIAIASDPSGGTAVTVKLPTDNLS